MENPRDRQPPSPEDNEALPIDSIVIRADEKMSLEQRMLIPSSLPEYQELVGGNIQGIDLLEPPAHMYVNEEGKVHGLPVNRRATVLLWMHNEDFRYRDIIVGDAFLLGLIGDDGRETTAPEQYTELLLRAESFHVEVQLRGKQSLQRMWPFSNWFEAYSYALKWALGPDNRQRPDVANIRVVPDM